MKTCLQSVYGDIYDCIDVYKQPSLSHPALRGLKIKGCEQVGFELGLCDSNSDSDRISKLISYPNPDSNPIELLFLLPNPNPNPIYKDLRDSNQEKYQKKKRKEKFLRPDQKILTTLGYDVSKSKNNPVEFNFWKSKKGCPKGTVPIQRTKMMNNQKNYSRDGLSHSLEWNNGIDMKSAKRLKRVPVEKNVINIINIQFAGIHSKSGQMFSGASALINIYNPKVRGPNQYSSATIFLENGDDQIQAGWTVNPQLYGDYRTRMYASWTRDSHRSTGCYNTQCPGFVVVNNKIPLGFVFNDISVREGKQYEEYFYMHLEPEVGWWLHVRDVFVAIGYWPISLFSTMQQSATFVRYGGQVFTPSSDDRSPQMGSGGKFVNGQYDKTCYMRQVSIRRKDFEFVDVDNSYMEGTDSRCYYSGDYSFKNDQDRYSFLFGGRGGTDEHTCVY
ncbi:hypothetical protein CDL12_18948 [Handroanthus impetiginosus]|uniref:Neprosin PEP catalytic domain-containing protein n=1 Tax=Handroanthus impetiginosus TaxID=429701 RepID=A0A2G9GT62_9LAMI|nr:hypothetical protein CDL12_18948 [Handroanthus impetiginosus]